MLAFRCIFVRSAARTNSVGACMLAATVWPGSTAREMTMPLIGEVMTVCARFTLTWFRLAFDCATDACADRTCASAEASTACADSSSESDTSCFPASLAVRSSASFAASRATSRRSTSASARMRFASACSTCVWKSDGSSRASVCPFRTMSLKSA